MGFAVYIGDSASLSFLQTIRRIVTSSIGPSSFTTDEQRHNLVEISPMMQTADIDEPNPNLEEAYGLARYFFLAASGALDLFDSSWFMEQLPEWVDDSSRSRRLESPIFYLVVAIGAAARAQEPADDFTAEYYFSYGRHQAIANLMGNPSILTVQAFALITWYMVTACRRNGAAMNIGIAVQAAYALGIHRHEANVAFPRDEGIARERAWKTLRVCDLFLSASMGRPPLTSDLDCNIPWRSMAQSEAQAGSEVRVQVSSAMLRICFLFERIITEVYSKRAVSLDLAASISKQQREWATELPDMLKIDGLSKSEHQDVADLTRYLGSAVVVMAYYYSIILLTRPFLKFRVCSHIKSRGQKPQTYETSPGSGVTTYSDACVSSAIKGIAMAHEVTLYAGMPNRLPLIINSVFISALSLGLAFFGDYDCRGWPLHSALTQAVAVLHHFGAHNPQSARYTQIIELLREAATQYTKRRDDHVLQSSSELVSEIFGKIPGQADPSPRRSSTTMPHNLPSPGTSLLDGSHDDWAGLDTPAFHSMITTAGTLASRPEGSGYRQPRASDAGANGFFDDICAAGTGSSHFSFGDEIPLFNMVSDYQYHSQSHSNSQHHGHEVEQSMFDGL
jgi:hypothetical protein